MKINRFIDHTLLKPEAKPSDIEILCSEARQFDFFSVCVNTSFVKKCSELLNSSNTKVCCVVGFPLGAMATSAKAFETAQAIKDGADEIDMVIHIGHLKGGNFDYVTQDIAAVVAAANGRVVKVIIETSLLSEDEKIAACQCALAAKAHFVKTSTGFAGGGATLNDVRLMKKIVQENMQVKASGGIKDLAQAEAMINAGATRLGTSSGVSIISGKAAQGAY